MNLFELTVDDMQTLKRDTRDRCGCDPICPSCHDRREFAEAFICAMLMTDTRTFGDLSDDVLETILAIFP